MEDFYVKCLRAGCGYIGLASTFEPTMSVYHDMRCPKCKTTNLDTSAALEVKPDYGYGKYNTLDLSGK